MLVPIPKLPAAMNPRLATKNGCSGLRITRLHPVPCLHLLDGLGSHLHLHQCSGHEALAERAQAGGFGCGDGGCRDQHRAERVAERFGVAGRGPVREAVKKTTTKYRTCNVVQSVVLVQS